MFEPLPEEHLLPDESLLILLAVHLVQFMMAYVFVQGPPGNEGPSGPRGPSGPMVCNVEAFKYQSAEVSAIQCVHQITLVLSTFLSQYSDLRGHLT